MTREQAKELLPIIQAWTEGQTIEYLDNEGRWAKGDDLSFCSELKRYRIKPEPKYRPFRSRDECWNEMLKHQPFGWLKDSKVICHIDEIFCDYINVNGSYLTHSQVFNNYEFFDGTPFGIMEE